MNFLNYDRIDQSNQSKPKQSPDIKGSNERLFILTRTQYATFGENPLYQATKRHR